MSHFANHEIAFDVPDDWTGDLTPKFVFPEEGAELSLTHAAHFRGMPLDLCALILQQQLGAVLGAVQEEIELVRRHVEPGRWLELVVEWPKDGEPMRAVVRAFVVGDHLWTLALRSPKFAVDHIRVVLGRTMASFTVRDGSCTPSAVERELRPRDARSPISVGH